jgi:UDP:flavonoid glycosyltransferase YjiC (YdhE family)
MLAVPHANDQPDNAWRLTRLGLARTVYPGAYKAARVARELEQLLADPRYAARAGEVAAQVAQDPGLPLACDVIEAALLTPG